MFTTNIIFDKLDHTKFKLVFTLTCSQIVQAIVLTANAGLKIEKLYMEEVRIAVC